MNRPVWIGTSWKMTKTLGEARAYMEHLAGVDFPVEIQPFVIPAHTSLAAARDVLPEGSRVLLGAQNAHWGPEGAGTGEVSMRMVADAGASLVEMGHSERREHHAETDETVALKARAAVDAALTPLICVGEPAEVRDAGLAIDFVSSQVRGALSRLTPVEAAGVIIAYEPIWAIGEFGRPARPAEVAPVMTQIARVAEEVGRGAGCRALLYGGSVDEANAADLLRVANTDGLFVGRAAWTPEGFLRLAEIAAESARARRRSQSAQASTPAV